VIGQLRRIGARARPTADNAYASVEAFCIFVGYPRSGHSLVGALLDAHPDMVIAHEANALRLVAAEGLRRRDLFERLLESSRLQGERPRGRRSSGYSYAVEGQWQGRFRRLRVVGDKGSKRTTSRIGRDLSELDKLQRVVGVPLRIVHVTRNPYDVIARMSLITRGGVPERPVPSATKFVARLARVNGRLIAGRSEEVLTVRQESFVYEPQRELKRVCDFLGVEAEDSYLAACAELVFDAPRRTREQIEWTEEEVEAVRHVIDSHAFLAGYSMSNDD
jgi:hypothetical protein